MEELDAVLNLVFFVMTIFKLVDVDVFSKSKHYKKKQLAEKNLEEINVKLQKLIVNLRTKVAVAVKSMPIDL